MHTGVTSIDSKENYMGMRLQFVWKSINCTWFLENVFLNIVNILQFFCVSQWSSSLVFILFKVSRVIDRSPYILESYFYVVVNGISTCFVTVLCFTFTCVPESCQHSTEFFYLTMCLITSIPYFSSFPASLIDFPTYLSLISM